MNLNNSRINDPVVHKNNHLDPEWKSGSSQPAERITAEFPEVKIMFTD